MRTLTFLITLIATCTLTLAAPAVADTGFPPVLGDTGGTTPTPGTPGGNPGGGGGSAPPAPEGTHWVYGGFHITPPIFNGHNGYGSDGYTAAWICQPKDVAAGDGDWLPTFVSWAHLIYDDGGKFAGGWAYSCGYPPKPEDSIATCYPWLDASVDRREPTEYNLVSKRITTPWGSNRRSVEACATSSEIAVKAALRDLGGYEVAVTARALKCTVRKYHDGRGTRIVLPCGNPDTLTKAKRAAVWCDGQVKWAFGPGSWNGKSPWDWTKCTGVKDELVQCVSASQPVTARGIVTTARRPKDVLDDGKKIAIGHQPFRVGGVYNLRDISSRMSYVKGEPMRNELPDNDDRQPTYLADEKGDPSVDFGRWYAGDVSEWDLRVVAPSPEGQPVVVQRDTRFTGTLDARTVTITGIDFTTMDLTTSTTVVPVTVTSVCDSAPAYVNALTSRNSMSQ